MHKPLVIIDIETSGKSIKNGGRILEIGGIRVENLQVVGSFNYLIYPEQPVPAFITKLTGITNEMAWGARTFAAVADELEAFLHDAIFIAHNVEFDYQFIKHEFKNIGIQYSSERLCSIRLSRRLHEDQRSHSLDSIIKRYHLTVTSRHRAADDAKAVLEFLLHEHGQNSYRFWSLFNQTMQHTRQ